MTGQNVFSTHCNIVNTPNEKGTKAALLGVNGVICKTEWDSCGPFPKLGITINVISLLYDFQVKLLNAQSNKTHIKWGEMHIGLCKWILFSKPWWARHGFIF
jgi:hypothetical protein